jgi:hypothetical protein
MLKRLKAESYQAIASIAIDADASCVDKLRGCIPDLTVINGDAISPSSQIRIEIN